MASIRSRRVVVCVGTKRGLFLLESSGRRAHWTTSGPYLKGWSIAHACLDTRGTPTIQAAANSDAFASTIFRASLKGRTFKAASQPPEPPPIGKAGREFSEQYGLPVSPKVWHVEPGAAADKKVVYCGTAPAGLFRSEDGGDSWEEITSLTHHPTRDDWQPGAGGMCLHSIQLDPTAPDRLYVGISAAGAFRSDDGGESWTPINKGIRRFEGAPLGDEVGTCVHKLLAHPHTGRLYQQNHIGVYRSDDHGNTWEALDAGLPFDFGFGLALNPHNDKTCYVVPLEPGEYTFRATPGAMRVFQLNKSGRGWKSVSSGLPRSGAYLSVLREGMASDSLSPFGLYVGTGSGHIFHSPDEGQHWTTLAEFLPPILSLEVAVL